MARYYLGSFRTYLEAEYDGGAEGEGLAVESIPDIVLQVDILC